MRGFVVQTLIALLDALEDEAAWISVALEPNVDSEKVDILWQYTDGSRKAVQVKSSQNPFTEGDVKKWAAGLEAWRKADCYELRLVGVPGSAAVAAIKRVGQVTVPQPKNLDLSAFKKEAAYLLVRFLESQRLPAQNADRLDDLVALLTENLASSSVTGQALTRPGLAELLNGWLTRTDATVRLVRVFVSAPPDVAQERAALDEIVASINRTEGDAHQVRLDLRTWDQDAKPLVGPGRRQVLDDLALPYDLYLGILSAAFGDARTGGLFRQACDRWGRLGRPWIVLYFDDAPKVLRTEAKAYVKLCDFREEVESQGIVCGYIGVRGSPGSFYEMASEHLRRTVHLLTPIDRQTSS